MAKTELTKKIEKRLLNYRPKDLGGLKLNYMRDQYDMYEVPVTHGAVQDGLIDYVWIAEGFRNEHKEHYCMAPKIIPSRWVTKDLCKCGIDIEDLSYDSYIENKCDGCRMASYQIVQDSTRAIICFEIKVSKNDYFSGHGKNFIGNLNYFVMPIDLYNEIAGDIPPEIGCIVFSDKGKQEILRKKKEAIWKEIDESVYSEMLLTAMNKYRKKWSKQLSEYRLKESAHLGIIDSLISQKTFLQRKYEEHPMCYKETVLTDTQKKYPAIYDSLRLCCSAYTEDNENCISCVCNPKYESYYKKIHCID